MNFCTAKETLVCQDSDRPFWLVLAMQAGTRTTEAEIEDGSWLATALEDCGQWVPNAERDRLWQDITAAMGLDDWDHLSFPAAQTEVQ